MTQSYILLCDDLGARSDEVRDDLEMCGWAAAYQPTAQIRPCHQSAGSTSAKARAPLPHDLL
jgi:hypothetical protein